MSIASGVIATELSAEGDGTEMSGCIEFHDGRYFVTIQGRTEGGGRSLRGAVQRLAALIAGGLPRQPALWSVSGSCAGGNHSFRITNRPEPGRRGRADVCVQRAAGERRAETLNEALSIAADIVTHCCGG